MAKFYNKKTQQVLWGADNIYCPLEDEAEELREYLAVRKLDGHDEYDQWAMRVLDKMDELLGLLAWGDERGIAPDVVDDDIKELL